VNPLGLVLAWLLLLPASAHAFTVRDMLGREVVLSAPPQRIVSLVPSVTEILYALGAEDRLVGVTTFCDFPPAAQAKPKVGGMVNPSLETIASLRPDLVLVTTGGNRESTIQQLVELGVPTYIVRPQNFSGVLESITRIGRLIGQEERTSRIVGELRHRADRVLEATRDRPRPSVLYLVWADPVIVPGRDTLITDLIRMAGGASVSGNERIDWPRLSLEQVVVKAPEVIVVATHSAAHVEDTLKRWRDQKILLPVFRTGRVHAIDGNLVHRPGPRVVDGLEALARAIHPGALP
jgi:iron complex transport system substrate-binding protein